MNSAIRAVARTCAHYNLKCTGIIRGYQGLIENDTKVLYTRSVRGIINRGGTFLYSARSDEFKTKQGRKSAYDNLIKNNIDGLVVIGGDGSFTGGLKLIQEYDFPVIGIPGTIDNDLFGTSNTLGYDTALNPEVNMSLDNLIDSLKRSKSAGKTSTIIVVAEGDKTGNNVFQLADTIETKLPKYEVRVSVLGHMQRGGSPSCFDRVLGTQMGITSVESLVNNEKGLMIGISNGKITKTDLSKAIKGKTKINKELLRMSRIMNT